MTYRARFEIHSQTGTTDPNAAMVHTQANGTQSVDPLTVGFSAVYPKTSIPVSSTSLRDVHQGNAVILSEALRWNASDASKGYVLSVVDDKSEDEDHRVCIT